MSFLFDLNCTKADHQFFYIASRSFFEFYLLKDILNNGPRISLKIDIVNLIFLKKIKISFVVRSHF